MTDNAPSPPVDLVFRAEVSEDDEDESDGPPSGHLYVLGSNLMRVYTTAGALGETFSLSSQRSALAAASFADGHAYATASGTGQLAVLSAGPWIEVATVEPSTIASDLESLTVTAVLIGW